MGKTLTLYDKIEISGEILLETGLHIGGSSEFSPIGALDNVVVRDSLTQKPMIPGSSLKGKLRFLLARLESKAGFAPDISDESKVLHRLFGYSGQQGKKAQTAQPANSDAKKEGCSPRLQFIDSLLTDKSKEKIDGKTDLYLTEIKFENTIKRSTSEANPRQMERVPAGAVFELRLIYNLETLDEKEIREDFQKIGLGFKLLQKDYLGGSGSRGYGRVEFKSITVHAIRLTDKVCPVGDEELTQLLKEQ